METKEIKKILEGKFNLPINREAKNQYYSMLTQFVQMGFDGKRKETEQYFLKIIYNPKELSKKSLDECTCKEFGLQFNNDRIVTIPKLKNWSYQFDPTSGLGKGLVFGIPHEQFEDLKDSDGNNIRPEIIYAIYNNFVDFHALSNLFTLYGTGIENLKQIGDKVQHLGAFSKAPIILKNIVGEGSVFCNGEVTLEFKGVSIIDNRPCALIKFDSGESTLDMSVITSQGYVKTIGGSQYLGDLYLDLESGWTRKVTFNEFVITERKEPNHEKEKRYTVRNLTIKCN
jgi:hypothetical protein